MSNLILVDKGKKKEQTMVEEQDSSVIEMEFNFLEMRQQLSLWIQQIITVDFYRPQEAWGAQKKNWRGRYHEGAQLLGSEALKGWGQANHLGNIIFIL